MKFALALLALVATTSAKIEIPNFGRGELYKDIQEFLDLLPTDQMLEICVNYLSDDAEVQNAFQFLQSKEFKDLVLQVEALSEIRTLMNYIHNAGIDIYKIVNALNNWLGIPPLTPPKDNLMFSTYKGKGLRGLLDDIEAILPLKQLQDLYAKKIKESKAFKEFVDQIKSDNFQQIVNKVYVNPTVQKMLTKAKDAGVDLQVIKEILETIFGLKIPSHPWTDINFIVKHWNFFIIRHVNDIFSKKHIVL